jgi:uroporphyrinogen III methyltransferase/synthase
MGRGKVYLVGAGPGDPELITRAGVAALERADVVVYDGLANARLLEHAPASAERIYAGKKHSEHGAPLGQRQIEALLVERAGRGLTVVRLKGGDPFVFGRGGEEAEALAAAGIPFEVVPGVSSFSAVPAYAGIPLTHRDVASTVVALATGTEEEGEVRVDWTAMAHADTLVLFMSVKTLPEVVSRLVAAGRDPATPAAAIRWGTTAAQRTVVAPLVGLPDAIAAAGLQPPALVVVGEVVGYRDRLSWYERRPLFGRRVLVPAGKEDFARAVADLGAAVVTAPLTRPLPLGARIAPAGQRWLVVTSANAVDGLARGLAAAGLDSRALAGMRIGAVGEATARALERLCLRADLVAEEPSGAGLARALLAADPGLPGAAVLWPCAEGARPELRDLLAAAGVRVDAVPVYRTETAVVPAADLDIVALFAPSQIDALGAAALGRARLVAAFGPTTAAALAARAVRVDVVAPAPTAQALADAILAHLAKEAR